MNIHFFLNDKEETPITCLYDLKSNPFSVNDVVSLEVEDLYPREYDIYKGEFKEEMIKDNEHLQKKINLKKIKLVKEGKYMKFKFASEPKLNIEYHCEIID